MLLSELSLAAVREVSHSTFLGERSICVSYSTAELAAKCHATSSSARRRLLPSPTGPIPLWSQLLTTDPRDGRALSGGPWAVAAYISGI